MSETRNKDQICPCFIATDRKRNLGTVSRSFVILYFSDTLSESGPQKSIRWDGDFQAQVLQTLNRKLAFTIKDMNQEQPAGARNQESAEKQGASTLLLVWPFQHMGS